MELISKEIQIVTQLEDEIPKIVDINNNNVILLFS